MSAAPNTPDTTAPWPLRIRVHGGRITHLAKEVGDGQWVALRTACGITTRLRDRGNDLRGAVCAACGVQDSKTQARAPCATGTAR